MSFFDLFSDKADLYASARPLYPDELFQYISSIAPSTDSVWDCGAGNGQASLGLSKHFKSVFATDPSAQQIANAIPCKGVQYSVQPAEETTFPAASFDAVCVAQALHWFHLEKFYREVRRVLKPNGILVVWGYSWFEVDTPFDQAFQHSILDVIHNHWAPQNIVVWKKYREIFFPFTPLEAPGLEIRASWNFYQLMAYIHTWSATRQCILKEGMDFFEKAARDLSPLWGDPEKARPVTMPLFIRVGKV